MSFLKLYRDQHTDLSIILTPEVCHGKTYIVSGSNTGLGYECVKHLVQLQASKVIMAVRNLSSGEKARTAIENETGIYGVIQVMRLDLGSYDSIRDFVRQVEANLVRVDGFVMNAGAAIGSWTTVEGMEGNQQINLMANLFLTYQMIPYLSRCARTHGTQPRITIIGSNSAFMEQKNFESIKMTGGILNETCDKTQWGPRVGNLYPISKLMLHLCVRELAKELPFTKTGVSINVTNPGICYSSLNRDTAFFTNMTIVIMRMILGRTTEMGSRTLLYGISVGGETHGKYMSENHIAEDDIPEWMLNERGQRFQKQIWEEVRRQLEKVEPGITSPRV